MKTTTEFIGPEQAKKYLATMGPPSYPVDPKLVASFAERMKSGAWIVGPEPLLVEDVDPEKMISGRRRMHAVVESGVTVEFVVHRGKGPFGMVTQAPSSCAKCNEKIATDVEAVWIEGQGIFHEGCV